MTSSTLLLVMEHSSSKRELERKPLMCRNLVHDGDCAGDILRLGIMCIFRGFSRTARALTRHDHEDNTRARGQLRQHRYSNK